MPQLIGWLKRIVPKNIAGIVGVLQALVPLVRELLVVVVRIAAIVVPGKLPENAIVGISKIFGSIESAVNKFKDLLLK